MTSAAPRTFPCWNCGQNVADVPLPLSRHEYCPACAEALHCCRQCRLFAPDRADQCLEERAEHPTDRTAANFCDYFQLRDTLPDSTHDGGGGDARASLDALFGSAPDASDKSSDGADAVRPAPDAEKTDPRARLNALFGDDDD